MVRNAVAERMMTAMKMDMSNEKIFAFRLNDTMDTSASFLVNREVFATRLMMNFMMKLRTMMTFNDIKS